MGSRRNIKSYRSSLNDSLSEVSFFVSKVEQNIKYAQYSIENLEEAPKEFVSIVDKVNLIKKNIQDILIESERIEIQVENEDK